MKQNLKMLLSIYLCIHLLKMLEIGSRDSLMIVLLLGMIWKTVLRNNNGDYTNLGFIMNEFNNIKKNHNESTFDFNVTFQKEIYKFFEVMKLDDNMCLTTYFNAFDNKMAYIVRDNDPKTLRDAFNIGIII